MANSSPGNFENTIIFVVFCCLAAFIFHNSREQAPAALPDQCIRLRLYESCMNDSKQVGFEASDKVYYCDKMATEYSFRDPKTISAECRSAATATSDSQ